MRASLIPPLVLLAAGLLPLCASGASPAAGAGARNACIEQAAARYNVHPDLVRAVIHTEGGTTGKVSWNANGSYDMGLMQINSIHLRRLSEFGISRDHVINNECVNIYVGSWLLTQAIAQDADFWRGVGRYHSATPKYNERYRTKVFDHLVRLWKERSP